MALLCLTPACASTPATSAQSAPPAPARAPIDTTPQDVIPAGYGTLRQDDVTIRLQPTGVLVNLLPLDESVLRVLAPDSYRYLHDLLESRRDFLRRSATLHGLRQGRPWYVEFIGLVPDARFIPTDVTITSGGRDFRPLEIVPVTSGFGQQRLQPHEKQRAIYLFDDAVDVAQPLTVTMGTERNTDWESILRNSVEPERSRIRARAASKP